MLVNLTIAGAHSSYPIPEKICNSGLAPQPFSYVSKTTFKPFAVCGIPIPPPLTNPAGGTSIKQKASPSAIPKGQEPGPPQSL